MFLSLFHTQTKIDELNVSFPSFQSRYKLTTSGLDRNSQRHSTREKALKAARVQTKDAAESLSTKKKNRSAKRRLCFNVFSIRSRLYWLIAFKIEFLALSIGQFIARFSVRRLKSWKQLFACLPQRKRKTFWRTSFRVFCFQCWLSFVQPSVNKANEKQSRDGNY